jgi:hypothetical protein
MLTLSFQKKSKYKKYNKWTIRPKVKRKKKETKVNLGCLGTKKFRRRRQISLSINSEGISHKKEVIIKNKTNKKLLKKNNRELSLAHTTQKTLTYFLH